MALFITGDTHGADRLEYGSPDGYVPRLNTGNFPEQKNLTKDDYVIICGDFGGIFDTDRRSISESKAEKHHLDWLDGKPFTTLFVAGNHENYDRLSGIKDEKLLGSWFYEKMPSETKEQFRKGYPQKKWFGSSVREIRPSVLMLETGVFELNGYQCFVYGGASSHDIQGGILDPSDYANEAQYRRAYEEMKGKGLLFRVKGLNWWDQEIPDDETEKRALKALEEAGWKVDYVFTHDCPAGLLERISHDPQNSRVNEFLEKLRQRLTFRQWFFGHYHQNIDFEDGKYHLLYERIIRID